MITPGFFGLYNAHRGLVATQNALNTVNHNITNANTPGYSRQRVDLTAYTPYTLPTKYGPSGGQIGQGPTVQQITRSRDQFLDAQFRQSNGTLGMDTALRDTLQQVEGILTEPSTSGINTAIQNFFDAAQEMSLHPESTAVRADFVQQAQDMLTVFQQQANQLLATRQNLVGDPFVGGSVQTSQLAINVNDVNDKLSQIANLNQSIITIQASGAHPNDLLDQRDKILDDLSQLVDIKVTNYDNGQIDLSVGGQAMIKGAKQIDSLKIVSNPTPVGGPSPNADDMPVFIVTVNGGIILNDGLGGPSSEITAGKIKGILDMGGNNPNLSTVRGTLGKLDSLLNEITAQMNQLQQTGRDLYGNPGADLFFLNPGASMNIFRWSVNAPVLADPKKVAAAANDPAAPGGFAGAGDGRNALAMAQLRDKSFPSLGTTFVDFFNSTVSKLGIDTRSYENTSASQENLVKGVDLQRQSVSGVNIDEEMIDLLRYQRAFEATSKTIKVFDEVTQTILNML